MHVPLADVHDEDERQKAKKGQSNVGQKPAEAATKTSNEYKLLGARAKPLHAIRKSINTN